MNQPSKDNEVQRQKGELIQSKTLTGIVYLLQAFGIGFAGIPALIAVIINYSKLSDVEGTWLESHFRWQIDTFWFAFCLGIIGLFTVPFVLGYFLMIGAAIFIIYRVIRGWSKLNIEMPMDKSML